MKEKISVVVCILNEEKRLEECLQLILKNKPDEIIVVDGGSSDKSLEIAKKFTNNIILSKNSSLTRDRQKGLNAAKNEYIALVDADHRLKENDLIGLLNDMKKFNFDAVQSQLKSYINISWLNKAEEQMWEINQNVPGSRSMIGVAPALYKKSLFKYVQFDDTITKTIDDTDFSYRLSQLNNVKYGIGETKIAQLHEGEFTSYMKKFKWYGIGDGEFCIKNKERTLSMLFHLFIRYPLIYSIKSIFKLKFYAVPYVILQGFTRFFWAVKTIVSWKVND